MKLKNNLIAICLLGVSILIPSCLLTAHAVEHFERMSNDIPILPSGYFFDKTDDGDKEVTDDVIVVNDDVEYTSSEPSSYYELPILGSDDTFEVSKGIIDTVIAYSDQYKLPRELVLAICYLESSFNPEVDNEGLNGDGSTDYGLMGLNDTYYEYHKDAYNNGEDFNPLDAEANIKIGVQILADIRNVHYDMYNVANSYNMGINGWHSYRDDYGYDARWYYGDSLLQYVYQIQQQCPELLQQ